MSEMKKIYITGLWLLCIVYGVSAQTYDIIERRNSWNAGENVTGIRMDSISSSYAELYGKNNHGDFHHSYEAEKSWNAGAIAKSITHLKGYSLTGSFSFDHTSGKDMSGSMFIQPGFYPVDEYDLAGFAVGVVDEKDLITGKDIKAGDTLIGIASSGVHSNGFSLVRSVFKITEEALNTYYDALGKTLGEALLAPTKIYVKTLKEIKNAGVKIKGCSHITGGGFYENVPRMLHDGVHAVIEKNSYEVPAIFKMLQNDGEIEEKMMYNTFNMGIGMVLAVDPADADKVLAAVAKAGETGYVIGRVEAGEKGVTVC